MSGETTQAFPAPPSRFWRGGRGAARSTDRGLANGRLVLAACLALALPAGAAADEVVLVPGATVKGAIGGRVRGTVQSESPVQVVVKLGATTTSVPTEQVASIRYDGQPPSFILAESRESAGLLAEAAEQYKKAAADAANKPLIVEAAKFHQAKALAELALAEPGRAAEAVSLLGAFTRTYPNSRHTAAALESLARLQVHQGDYAPAEATIAALAKLPQVANRASVLRARLFARRGNHDQAVAELDRLIRSAPEGSAARRAAQLAKAEGLAALKKFKEAEAEVRAVLEAVPAEDAAAKAAAYNTLGDCLRAAGKPKDALVAYLYTDIIYDKDKEQHPRALARITQLWRELKQDDRADEVGNRLKKEYPQSPWVKETLPAPGSRPPG